MVKMLVPYNYLDQQFNVDSPLVNNILGDIKELVRTGEFTLGPPVQEFEEKFAELCGVKHAIGINSGTDALILILKALGKEKGSGRTPRVLATLGELVLERELRQQVEEGGFHFGRDSRLFLVCGSTFSNILIEGLLIRRRMSFVH